ncbi:DegT/DnrJ/EryC1/StrS family aminotransferase [Micromonospora sp. CPCC 206061]|uniref:DegT/DnrJ/EryC1/StrS family aminotransferase n=1 Tax=Micromonospora sp. CPCC 206061 TaxID=3122410 RepID=UPI002FEFDC93
MRVPFVDLAVRDQTLHAELLSAIGAVLDRGDYILGAEVTAFEQEFAAYCGARFAVGVSSGTSALVLALRALGVGPGAEVITVANSFLSTVSSILLVGARPVLVDVADDENIDVDAVRQAISPRTKAIFPVHLRGRPARMAELIDLAREHDLHVVADCSQAQGARIDAERATILGDLGCFSLHPLKNLPAPGDAGVIVTNHADLAERLRTLRNHGLADRGFAVALGDNARLDTVHAATLRVRLRRLDRDNARRRSIADAYNEAFTELPVVLPARTDGVESVYHHYVMQVSDRTPFLESMSAAGVDVRIHYPVPAHQQPAFTGAVTLAGELRRTEEQAGRIVSLPCSPALSDEQVRIVIDAVREHYRAAAAAWSLAADGVSERT